MDYYVKSETHNSITTIRFFHPQSNSLPAKMLEMLAQQIHGAGHDEDTSVIIIRSEGEKAFCAGASFQELSAIKTAEEGLRFFSGFADVINAMRKSPKMIIAGIHSRCIGGGVGLAAAADYAIAVEGADIKLSELAIGIGPFVVGPAIERRIGFTAFSHLAIDGAMWRSADWARRKGLYAELHPDIGEMEESIRRLSHFLAHSNPVALTEMKRIFWKGTEHWDHLLAERAAISGKLILSDFSKKAIAAFSMKSPG